MTDTEFLSFILDCTLSAEQIARVLGMSIPNVQKWRRGERLPHPSVRDNVVKELSRTESFELTKEIQEHNDKFKR